MRIIHLIDRTDNINRGVWEAAISTTDILKEKFGIDTQVWYPQQYPPPSKTDLESTPLMNLSSKAGIELSKSLEPDRDIIVSHGTWRFPSKWGYAFQKRGFQWIATPQGMLEPWSLQQKKLKKQLYFHLFERQYLKSATVIRAVSRIEQENLQQMFPFSRVILIPNGISPVEKIKKDYSGKKSVLFLSRLHHKKGVGILAEAWNQSSIKNHPDFELVIVGPDQGEGHRIQKVINRGSKNIVLTGSLYGTEKEEILRKAHFYTLPSFSEGFPTAVLEGINYGLFPLISTGCNFPELLEAGHGFLAQPELGQLTQVLNKLPDIPPIDLEQKARAAQQFVQDHYSLQAIARQQANLYNTIIDPTTPTS